MSGAVGLSYQETGTRGMWWEKRRALFDLLARQGHELRVLSKLTKATLEAGGYEHLVGSEDCDVLVVEFGGSNKRFFGDDLAETRRLIRAHKGKVVFICDDPDLWFPWKDLPDEDWSRWTVWVNATGPADSFPVPPEATVVDFPFSSLQATRPPTAAEGDKFVYLGRPSGRAGVFKKLIAAQVPLQVYGRAKEWEELGMMVREAPAQPARGAFYGKQFACLAIADAKHKRMGWRTGRAYHAIAAGCPAVAESDHPGLSHLLTFSQPRDLVALLARLKEPGARTALVIEQQAKIVGEQALVSAALQKLV